MRKNLLTFAVLWPLCALQGQVVPLKGIINHYAAATAIDTCTGRLSVSDTLGFQKGTQVLLWQTQGAEVFSLNVPLSGTFTALNGAGLWERNRVDSVTTGGLFLQKRLLNNYHWNGNVQIITLPVYENARVTDTVRAMPWNGRTGGIIALEVTGTLVLDAPVSADAAGFRGGAAYIAPVNNCNVLPETGYIYAAGTWRSSFKGEGLAGIVPGREMGRGPVGNGGGGGNDHNSGGGGGAHLVRGGTGGNNDEPQILGCRGFFPGIGAYAIPPANPQRLFAGGGGGAGHANNPPLTNGGGRGGGVIWLQAGTVQGAVPALTAAGAGAATANNDGGGGGGAGGTIRLQAANLPPQTRLDVSGGDGGSMDAFNSNRCHGPGGGGAGGRILTAQPAIYDVSGGAPGRILRSLNGCNGSTGSAGAGQNGSVEDLPSGAVENTKFYLPSFLKIPRSDTLCPGDTTRLAVEMTGNQWTCRWQEEQQGKWLDLTDDARINGSNTAEMALRTLSSERKERRFRCVVRLACGAIRTSPPATISFVQPPAAAFTATDTLSGCNEVRYEFRAEGAYRNGVKWSFSDGQPLASSQTAVQWRATADGKVQARLVVTGVCPNLSDTLERTFVVRLLPSPQAEFQSMAIGREVSFQSSLHHVSSVQWLFGDNSQGNTLPNPVHTYAQPGTYIVSLIASNGCGARIIQQKLRVHP